MLFWVFEFVADSLLSSALTGKVEDVQVPSDLALLVNSDRMLLPPLGAVVRLPLPATCKVRRLPNFQKAVGRSRGCIECIIPQLQEDGVHVDGSAVRKDGVDRETYCC